MRRSHAFQNEFAYWCFCSPSFQLLAKIPHNVMVLADPFAAQFAIQSRSFTKVVRQHAAAQSMARLKDRHFATTEIQTLGRRQASKPATNHHAAFVPSVSFATVFLGHVTAHL